MSDFFGTVYVIKNSETGKSYVGSTVKTIEERLKAHIGKKPEGEFDEIYKIPVSA